jgi:hypothetical protein
MVYIATKTRRASTRRVTSAAFVVRSNGFGWYPFRWTRIGRLRASLKCRDNRGTATGDLAGVPSTIRNACSTEIQVKHLDRQTDDSAAPPANKALLTVAAVLLAAPVVALLWVASYARVEPTLAGFPFFIWYQFVWVFLCAACTGGAYRLALMARPHRPLSARGEKHGDAGR